MTEFLARKLTPEQEQAKREQIAREDALVAKADLEAYSQFGFNPDDPDQAAVVRRIIRVRKHMTTYDVFGHKLVEVGMYNTVEVADLPEEQPTDMAITSPITYPVVPTFTIAWKLEGVDGSYTALWHVNMFDSEDSKWIAYTPMNTYPIETGDVYDDMDCVHGTIVGSYMCENKMFPWQKD